MEKWSAMDAFEKLEKVGEGTYGRAYRAREKATGKIVALEKTRLHEDDEGVPPTILREVSLLRMLSRDPHVVRYPWEDALGLTLPLTSLFVVEIASAGLDEFQNEVKKMVVALVDMERAFVPSTLYTPCLKKKFQFIHRMEGQQREEELNTRSWKKELKLSKPYLKGMERQRREEELNTCSLKKELIEPYLTRAWKLPLLDWMSFRMKSRKWWLH
ncbi:uncharacterized protein LOC131161489 [Malania oleifera]|uniref:uncharacterized protein LOC131161489 n=1 Tax=Malania oleifera TaxID=397392 RepID=UPI0025ADBDD8|nr:uncharacterized protein LOC131161489 [Malania oleifera]